MASSDFASDRIDPLKYRNEVSNPTSTLVSESAGEQQCSGGLLLPSIGGKRDVVDRNEDSGLLAAVAALREQSDCLPAEILDALRKTSKRPLQYQRKTTVPCPPPSNLWNFPHRRTKLRHLTDNPPCVAGAGKDISFLHDVHDGQFESQLPDTLIPEEYHVVKDPGVLGLEIRDDKYTTTLEDKDKLLRVFPSSRPGGRKEVIALRNAMEDMLEKAGVDNAATDSKCPTQMHRLCELVKQEQTVYNLVFHELIRQISVQCTERGHLLALLRQKYVGLLDRIPKEVKGLHDEVLAQRSLDRRLMSELNRFQSAISNLTDELNDVRQHDTEVTKQASEAKYNLETALLESEKNASLVAEYHDLYEMQRHRLENQLSQLTKEKELWQKAARSLAMKVAHHRSLKTSQRLQLSEKVWSKLAAHFVVILSDRDSQQLTELQNYVQMSVDLLLTVTKTLVKQDSDMKLKLSQMLGKIHQWQQQITLWLAGGRNSVTSLTVRQLWLDVKSWEDTVSCQSEKFTGDSVLDWQDKLADINRQVEGWTETAIHVFNRHNVSDDHEGEGHQVDERVKMLQLNEAMETFLLRLQIRVSGENGVAKILIHLVNPLETWAAKLNTVISGTQVLPMSEWQKLCEQLGDWANHVENAIDRVGLHVKENIPITEEIREEAVSVDAIVKDSRQWMKSVYSSIENEDGALVEQVSVLHADMVEWMVQVLLRLTEEKLENEQDEDENEEQKGEEIIDDKETFISTPDIKTARDGLAYRINILSNRLNKCCTDVLQEQLQAMLGLSGEGNTEMELRDLKRMGFECHQWTQTSDLLVEELTAKDAGQWVAPSWHHLRQNDPLAKKRQGIKSEEKLSVTAEDDRDTLERQSVHVIGSDENLTQEPLASVAIDKETVIETESPSVAVLASEAPIPLGRSSSPHDALLSAIDSLEQQLKASEALVLTAEGRASRAEEKLKAAQEQIEALEQQERKLQQEVKSQQQQLNQQQQSPRRGGPPSRGAGSRQVQGSKKGSSVYQPRRGTPDTVASGGIPSSGARK